MTVLLDGAKYTNRLYSHIKYYYEIGFLQKISSIFKVRVEITLNECHTPWFGEVLKINLIDCFNRMDVTSRILHF